MEMREHKYMHADWRERSQKLFEIQNKLVWPPPGNNIFRQGGKGTAGSLFDAADRPRVGNEEVDYALIGAPSVFVGQMADTTSVEANFPLSTMDSMRRRLRFKGFTEQLVI